MTRAAADGLGGRAAIVGIGATAFSKDSGRSELSLAAEAIRAALHDAGLTGADVDGLTTFAMDSNPEMFVADAIGAGELTFFSRIHYGGSAACATVMQAALAVNSGIADVVVCYRALNGRSGVRYGSGAAAEAQTATTDGTRYSWFSPYGLRTPAGFVALFAQRYLHAFGASPDAFGQVAVSARRYAATNPAAYFYGRPVTLEDHRASRLIAEPLRLLDCCQESDGAVALVVCGVDRARTLRRPPAVITAAAQGSAPGQQMMTAFDRGDLTDLPEMGVIARQLWRSSGLAPGDIDAAILYDHFTPWVIVQLEEFGFCPRGEGHRFVADGNLDIDGALPVNTNGGQLGEAYVHGMNGIAEAVRQVRGEAVNQVAGAEHVLATAAPGSPSSALILSHDPR